MKKNIVLIGEAFLELEPFEHERHASGSRFNLNLELRIWNWSWPAYRGFKAFKLEHAALALDFKG